eukprot:gene11946-12089_t
MAGRHGPNKGWWSNLKTEYFTKRPRTPAATGIVQWEVFEAVWDRQWAGSPPAEQQQHSAAVPGSSIEGHHSGQETLQAGPADLHLAAAEHQQTQQQADKICHEKMLAKAQAAAVLNAQQEVDAVFTVDPETNRADHQAALRQLQGRNAGRARLDQGLRDKLLREAKAREAALAALVEASDQQFRALDEAGQAAWFQVAACPSADEAQEASAWQQEDWSDPGVLAELAKGKAMRGVA